MIFSASTLACICVRKILEAFGINVCEWGDSRMYQPGTGGTGGAEGGSGESSTGGESGSASIPHKAKDTAKQVKANNGTSPKGYKGGRTYKNIPLEDGAQKLPERVNYKEYDMNPYVKGENSGTERIVMVMMVLFGIQMTIIIRLRKLNRTR